MKIISFEGVEGVGKSTQISMLDSYLVSKGLSTEVLREPGSTKVGENIRDILLNTSTDLSNESELLLMFAARAQLISEKINNSDKDVVLFDRSMAISLFRISGASSPFRCNPRLDSDISMTAAFSDESIFDSFKYKS